MTNYYKVQSHFYDCTRWAFLYGRKRLIETLDIREGERVVEIGCGTGANFSAIQRGLRNTGELIGIDCSGPMLRKAEQRAEHNGWTNVRLVDLEYGKESVTQGQADVVLFSYSLSMVEDWKRALSCARSELRPGGRAGVLDFCAKRKRARSVSATARNIEQGAQPQGKAVNSSNWFTQWLAMNHVQADRPYQEELNKLFEERTYMRHDAWAGLWSFYLFVGARQPA
jgi:S-adenosylmethionine-diacylgycerolhomoserine-N-methlytransferase